MTRPLDTEASDEPASLRPPPPRAVADPARLALGRPARGRREAGELSARGLPRRDRARPLRRGEDPAREEHRRGGKAAGRDPGLHAAAGRGAVAALRGDEVEEALSDAGRRRPLPQRDRAGPP